MSEHTPTPWRATAPIAVAKPTHIHIIGRSVADGVIAKVNAKSPANAAFIVLACNSHGELVEALEKSAVALEEASKLLFAKGLQGCASIMMGHRDIALAAVAKAKGEAL